MPLSRLTYAEAHKRIGRYVCMRRDPKGLYAKAQRGELQHLTGLSDPYEEPVHSDVVVDTDCETPDRSVETILWSLTAMRVG